MGFVCLSYRFSALWKGITSVREDFQLNITCRVGLRDNIYFWLDCRIGDTTLAEQFPDLFSCARDKQAKVSNYMLKVADSIHWSPVFRRNLSQSGESQFSSLLDLLYQSSIVGETKIVKSGPLQRMVCFQWLLSFQPCLMDPCVLVPFEAFRTSKSLQELLLLVGWLCGSILTMDSLKQRKMAIVNPCPLCLEAEDTVDHILLTCKLAQSIWLCILGLFGYSWVFPSSILGRFEGCNSFVGSSRGKIMWKISFLQLFGQYRRKGIL